MRSSIEKIEPSSVELHATHTHAQMMKGFSSGMIFSLLHIVGPQHIGALMTLSSVTTKGTAFTVGAACGLGHTFGMIFVALVALSVHSVATVDTEAWEYYGNYLIGVSLILCALYLMIRETVFLEQPCACHSGQHTTPLQRPAESTLPSASTSEGEKAGHASVSEQCDRAMHHEQVDHGQLLWSGRSALGALVGMLQGTCCPLVMVGVSFMATLHAAGIVMFLITFMVVTALGTGFLAVLWASATNSGICGGLSPKFAFRVSCYFTLVLGIGWVTANYFDILDKLNYAEAAERANLYILKKG